MLVVARTTVAVHANLVQSKRTIEGFITAFAAGLLADDGDFGRGDFEAHEFVI